MASVQSHVHLLQQSLLLSSLLTFVLHHANVSLSFSWLQHFHRYTTSSCFLSRSCDIFYRERTAEQRENNVKIHLPSVLATLSFHRPPVCPFGVNSGDRGNIFSTLTLFKSSFSLPLFILLLFFPQMHTFTAHLKLVASLMHLLEHRDYITWPLLLVNRI